MDQNVQRAGDERDTPGEDSTSGAQPPIQEKSVRKSGKFGALLLPAVLAVVVIVGLILVLVLLPGRSAASPDAAPGASAAVASSGNATMSAANSTGSAVGSTGTTATAGDVAVAAKSGSELKSTGAEATQHSSAGAAASSTEAGAQTAKPSAAQATSDQAGTAAPAAASEAPAFDITTRTEQPPMNDEESFIDWMLKNYPEPDKQEQLTLLHAKWARMEAIRSRGDATNPRILEAFLRAPREYFSRNIPRSYDDAAMPIGYGQTISGPHLVSHMTQALDPQPDQRVLEIGTGSGYQSSVLSELSNYVYTIEIVPELYKQTDAIYTSHYDQYPEFRNIHRKNADGYYGWAEYAPFDRIIVTCGIDHIPPDLLKQLAPGGIMVIPVGPPSGQTVLKITKEVNADGSISLKREDIYHGHRSVVFVPFTSKTGLHTMQADNVQTENAQSGSTQSDNAQPQGNN